MARRAVVGFGHRPTGRTVGRCDSRHDVEAIRRFADPRAIAAACADSPVQRSAPPAMSSNAGHGRPVLIIVVQEGPGRQGGVGPGLSQPRRPIIGWPDALTPCPSPKGRGEQCPHPLPLSQRRGELVSDTR